MKNRFKITSGFIAFFVYFAILGLLLNYFNHHRDEKSVHYVEKNENRIEVAMSSQKKKKSSKKKSTSKKASSKTESKEEEPKPKPEQAEKPKSEPKPVEKPKPKPVEKPKPEPVEKPKPEPKPTKEPKKKVEMSSLFAGVNETKPKPDEDDKESEESNAQEERKSDNKNKSDSLKNVKSSDSGIENRYLAKVESTLQNWPAQSEFAGETIKVSLMIRQDGSFDFKLLTVSNNESFNIALVQYLEQLQKIGFGLHRGEKPYEIDVEFIAKD